MSSKRRALKEIKPFDNPRQVSERTDPDYVEKKVVKMASEILALDPEYHLEYFKHLEYRDRKDIVDYLSRWPKAEAVMLYIEEAKRCLTKARSSNGAVCVAGKGLDLLLHNLNLGLEGTLGKKLKALSKLTHDPKLQYRLNDSSGLVKELTQMWDHLKTRNLGAHYDPDQPDVSVTEAEGFIAKVKKLYEHEKRRQGNLAASLEAGIAIR